MNARLERLRDEVRTGMGQFFTDADWPDETIDRALKQGMTNLLAHFPAVTQDITLTQAGYSHNLATYIPDIFGVIDVTHPWDPANHCHPETPYQLVGRTYIQFARTEPQAGDLIHVLYRPFYTIGELDGATTDTLPAEYEPAIVLAACSNMLRNQAMNPPKLPPNSKPNPNIAAAGQMSIVLLNDAISAIYDMHANYRNPVWSTVGL